MQLKQLEGLVLLIGLLLVASNTAVGQSTEVVQQANFVLKGIEQSSSGVTYVRMGNKDILAALNASGDYNFSARAALLFVSTDDQPPRIVVRDMNNGQVTNVDVGVYFGVSETGDAVHSTNGLTRWTTWVFALSDGQSGVKDTEFQLWGRTTLHTVGAGTTQTHGVQSDVSGVGSLAGAVTIFYGTVQASDAKAQPRRTQH